MYPLLPASHDNFDSSPEVLIVVPPSDSTTILVTLTPVQLTPLHVAKALPEKINGKRKQTQYRMLTPKL
ncbi:hypothetical protein [Pseudoalteromonas sp. PPB1]|uniref:hypothetical protein n=1 Tax=Pseudoalteromonas sp. PPB1 TaxID=2756136 RepID=UPI001891221E|nr:hypothetical protein [Pseudoalteromonas sp. PPB1]